VPAEYVQTRDAIRSKCDAGDHPDKEKGESCSSYAKRVAAAIYAKEHGKPPTHASDYADLIERVEKLLGMLT